MSSIAFTEDGPVAIIALDRPAKLNAITPEMLSGLVAAIERAEDAAGIRAVVLAGRGRTFSVGADIAVWSALSAEDFRIRWVIGGHRAFDRIASCRKPVVAALHGLALGGGLELALAADLRVAEAGTGIALPEVSLGTVPGWGGTQRLPELVGIARAKQLILTGERIDAETAERWNLVNVVAPSGGALDAAVAMARRISEMAPVSVELAKALVEGRAGRGTGVTLEALAGVVTAATEDVKEGIAALKAKRPPRFEGR